MKRRTCLEAGLAATLAAAAPLHAAHRPRAVAVNAFALPPYSTFSRQRPGGLFVELLTLVGERAGIDFRFHFMPVRRAQEFTRHGHDCLLAPQARTADVETDYRWIVPILSFETFLFTLGHGPLNWSDLGHQPVGLMVGTPYEGDARAAGFTNLQLVQDETSNARKLRMGRIRGWIASEAAAPGAYREAGYDAGDLVRGPKIGPTKTLYIAGAPGLPDEIELALWEQVGALKRSGLLDVMIARYQSGLPNSL
jgi:hypothetical protein